jgi:ABC-type transport system involved in cytochrome c biogenesis permease subunit
MSPTPGFLRPLAARLGTALASFHLSVACLLGLWALTWLGTLYQVEHGLWEAQRAYFESLLVVQRVGDLFVGADVPAWLDDLDLAVPLPGGMLLMGLLATNLLAGGFVRLVRSLAGGTRLVPRLGVLTVHAGIALLLLAGFVRFHCAVEGSLTLFEGQVARSYQSFHDWEIAVRRAVADDEVEEHAIPGSRFLDLAPGRRVTFTSPSLPFPIVVERAARNSSVAPSPHAGESIDGFALVTRPPQPENERNVAGCIVAVQAPGSAAQRAILCGTDTAPWTVEAGGIAWTLQLRKQTHPLPFALRLDDFTAEMYPGTSKPKSFRSDVTVIEPDGGRRRVRIQMNEPLRKGDVVIYQSTWGQQGMAPGAPLFSGFQVVRNPADQWPLVGCLVVAAGMLLAFGHKLVRFLWRQTPVIPVAASLFVALLSAPLAAQASQRGAPPGQAPVAAPASPSVRAARWDPAIVDRFARLPVQDDGRIKPLLTHVSYLLLRLHGSRTLRLPDGTALSPAEWALDLWLFPERAERYPVFQVQTSEVIDALELDHDGKKKRDRYSLAELRPGLPRLVSLAERYARIPENERSPVEQQIVLLAHNVDDHQAPWRWIPPADAAAPTWFKPGELGGDGHGHGPSGKPDPVVLLHHERLRELRADPAAFGRELTVLGEHLRGSLRARGEGEMLDAEVAYLRADWFYRALLAFGLGFLLAAFGWLWRNRWLDRATWAATGLGLLLVVWGIVTRCLLRARPPISGLYDTLLFVAGAIVLAALLLELLHRRRVFLSLAAGLGLAGMFLAGRFEASEGRDTMPTLQAVLDTNFWLATHVTVINLGYAGTLLAGFLAHVWLLGGRRRRERDPAFFRSLSVATYGTLCFATLFTTVGTILGGIWANDSWGRFWGWDPKENGALMIVLWNLAILHARLGGFARDYGIAMLCVGGNLVVAFSWFHTNLLGVGLHSYGFAAGLNAAVWSFYALETLVLVAGWRGRPRQVAAA